MPSAVGLEKTHPSDTPAGSFVSICCPPWMLGFIFIKEGKRHFLMRSERLLHLPPVSPQSWGSRQGVFPEISGRDGFLSLCKEKEVSLDKGRSGQRVSGFVHTSGLFLHSGEETKHYPSLSLRALCVRGSEHIIALCSEKNGCISYLLLCNKSL